jgi:nucleoside-diphosphate-sugar epimerase
MSTATNEPRPLVIITGAGGNIGTAAHQALRQRFHVVGMERDCENLPECVPVDITSDTRVRDAMAMIGERFGNRIASFIHLAAYFDLSGKPSPLYQSVNIEGTQRLLEALQAFEVDQFIYASTMLVHAPTRPGIPINEESPLGPSWPYPESKLRTEEIIKRHCGAIPYVLLRIAGVYTDRCGSTFLAHQIRRIYERQVSAHLYAADPAVGQAFIHMDDLLHAILDMVARRRELPAHLALLLGEPDVLSYEALQNRLAHLIHDETQWTTRRVPQVVAKVGAWLQAKAEVLVPDVIDQGEEPFIKPFMAEMADDHFEVDITQARTHIDWEPRSRLRDKLPEMVAALKADPIKWYREHRLIVPGWLRDAERMKIHGDQLMRANEAILQRKRARSMWAHVINLILGAWLITSPPILSYGENAMIWNDIACGAAVMVFAFMSLLWRAAVPRFLATSVGVWLLFAPLMFWAGSAAAYLNDTVIGSLVIGFALLVGPVPGVSPIARTIGPDIPPGWSYNPSGWLQRLTIILLAVVGLFVSRYLAAYQLGHIPSAWDPFFAGGTQRIITSKVSEAWPVSDAGLGAVTYMLEILTGFFGDRRRWRTSPWAVILFGVMIVPLGAVSVFFIIIQPIVIGTWCTLCLVAAAAMLLQVPYSLDELLACIQFLIDRKRSGRSLLRTFLFGDTIAGGAKEPPAESPLRLKAALSEMFGGGVNLPPSLLGSMAIGIWLMFTRIIFGTDGAQADSDHLLGFLIITVAVSALAEMARPLRFINILFGIGLMGAPWMLHGGSLLADVAGAAAGVVLIALSIPAGRVRNSYGNWDRLIR